MLPTVADTTLADRVLLLTGEAEQLIVRFVYESGKTTTVDGPWTEVPYDHEIVRRVVDSGTPLIVAADSVGVGNGLGRQGQQSVSSTLAVPVRVRENTNGVIYAEHHEPGRYFTGDHEEAVAFLCAQAAAPLWNFQLEARLRAADEHRQSLMDVQSRFVPNELLRILDIDDLRRVRSGYRVERPMTVLISDIRGYTALLEDMNVPTRATWRWGSCGRSKSDHQLQRHDPDVRGDEVLAVFESEPDAVRAGLAILRSLREHNRGLAHGSRSCGWESVSIPASWGLGSSVG